MGAGSSGAALTHLGGFFLFLPNCSVWYRSRPKSKNFVSDMSETHMIHQISERRYRGG